MPPKTQLAASRDEDVDFQLSTSSDSSFGDDSEVVEPSDGTQGAKRDDLEDLISPIRASREVDRQPEVGLVRFRQNRENNQPTQSMVDAASENDERGTKNDDELTQPVGTAALEQPQSIHTSATPVSRIQHNPIPPEHRPMLGFVSHQLLYSMYQYDEHKSWKLNKPRHIDPAMAAAASFEEKGKIYVRNHSRQPDPASHDADRTLVGSATQNAAAGFTTDVSNTPILAGPSSEDEVPISAREAREAGRHTKKRARKRMASGEAPGASSAPRKKSTIPRKAARDRVRPWPAENSDLEEREVVETRLRRNADAVISSVSDPANVTAAQYRQALDVFEQVYSGYWQTIAAQRALDPMIAYLAPSIGTWGKLELADKQQIRVVLEAGAQVHQEPAHAGETGDEDVGPEQIENGGELVGVEGSANVAHRIIEETVRGLEDIHNDAQALTIDDALLKQLNEQGGPRGFSGLAAGELAYGGQSLESLTLATMDLLKEQAEKSNRTAATATIERAQARVEDTVKSTHPFFESVGEKKKKRSVKGEAKGKGKGKEKEIKPRTIAWLQRENWHLRAILEGAGVERGELRGVLERMVSGEVEDGEAAARELGLLNEEGVEGDSEMGGDEDGLEDAKEFEE